MRVIIILALGVCAFAQGGVDWVKQVKNKPTVDPRTYDFKPQSPGGALTASTPATKTLAPCPYIATGNYLYLSGGTGTAESVSITATTCTGGAASGTVTFTPANNHSGAWTVKSATSGIQEAVNAAPRGAMVSLTPGTYTVKGGASLTISLVNMRGSGVNDTVIACDGGTGTTPIIYVSNTGAPRGYQVSDFTVDATACSTRYGIELVGFTYNSIVQHVNINKAAVGLYVALGSGYSAYKDISIWEPSTYGVYVNGDSSGDLKFDNIFIYGPSSGTATAAFYVAKTNALDLGAIFGNRIFAYGPNITTGFLYDATGAQFAMAFLHDLMMEAVPHPATLKNVVRGRISNSWINSFGGLGGLSLDGTNSIGVVGNTFVGGGYGVVFSNAAAYTDVNANDFSQCGAALSIPDASPPTAISWGVNVLGSATLYGTSTVATAIAALANGGVMKPFGVLTDTTPSGAMSFNDYAAAKKKYVRSADGGNLEVVNDGFNAIIWSLDDSGNVFNAGYSKPGAVVLSTLPACSSGLTGALAVVTDSTVTTVGTTITGSGTHKVLGTCNGTNWVVLFDYT